MMFSFSMICMFPLCGLFADKFNLHITFFVLGIIQILMMVLLINRKKDRK
ncbi:hypothetical protein [Clostridium butyricum]|nr:hypothetical protein [Clostridium butyricum]